MPDLLPAYLSDILTIDQVQVVTNKSMSGNQNTFTDIPNSALDKISDKTKLNDDVVYRTIGAYNQALLEHSDIVLTNLADGDFLEWDTTTSKWINVSSSSLGEANTYSNQGTGGIGIILTKNGVDLPFKSLYAKSAKVEITDGGANNRVEIDVNLTHFKLDGFGTPDDSTNLNVTTTYHGLCPKLPNDASKYLNGLGSWSTVTGGTSDDAGIVRVDGVAINSVARKINFSADFSGTDDAGNGDVDIDIKDASTTQKGIVELAANNESAAGLALQSNDDRLTNARTPTAHASTTHLAGQSDYIRLDDLATADDNTDLDATTGHHGLLMKLGGGTTNYLRADGTWSNPVSAGGLLVRNVTDLTVSNSTTHTNVLSYAFGANEMGTNKIIHCRIEGYIIYNSGTPKLGIEIKLGTTIFYDYEAGTISASSDKRPFVIDFNITMKGVHNSQSLGGFWGFQTDTGGVLTAGWGEISDDEGFFATPLGGVASEATNVAKTLQVNLWNNSASSSVSFTRTMSYMEMK